MLAAAVLMAVALMGCGSSSKATNGSQSPASSEVAAGCTSQRDDVAVQVTIYAGGPTACMIWNKQSARKSGPGWHLTTAMLHIAPVCSVARGASVIEVRQGGAAEQGQSICTSLKSKAWTEVEGPGERAEKAARQH